ncbi:MAG TPA: glycerol-3-phosphate dehydrogenase C-terminal domain-containing protein [Chitinophagaceae bacterium]|nr:glycerol-3-phosphate dehydrogenase C-terminal domain-containing protein [Chitinophagaceae bacterium]
MNGTSNEWLSEELKIHRKQIVWAVEHEMARTVEDVLSRRTRALLLNARESRRIAPECATIMAALMGKDEQWKQEQVNSFNKVSEQYILK